MPIDPFAALNAMVRAEATGPAIRTDEPELHRQLTDADADSGAAPDRGSPEGERTETGSRR
jgi:hypothetical protein